MATMRIDIPAKRLNIIDEKGVKTGEILTFKSCLLTVVESKPVKSTTEITLAHSIVEKAEAIEIDTKNFDMEEAEVDFVKNAMRELMDAGKIQGSRWYYLINPLNSAVLKQKLKEK